MLKIFVVVWAVLHVVIELYILPEDGPWGPKHVVSEKEHKRELMY
jgi:hypothetical protein